MIDELLSLVPPHRTFADHTAGGLSLLLAMDPEGRSEVVNDIDMRLVNFWRVLQDSDCFEKFQRQVQCVPFSQPHFRFAKGFYDQGPIENAMSSAVFQAVEYFILIRQSMGGSRKSFAPISTSRTRGGMNEQASAWLNAVDGLRQVHERLRRVVILNTDLHESIDVTDNPEAAHYIDVPYMADTRVSKDLYRHEFSDDDHRRLLERLLTVKGKFLLCGYPSPLYADYARRGNWNVHTFEKANSASKKKIKPKMQECVWTNY